MSRQVRCPECDGEGRYIPIGLMDPTRCESCLGHGHITVKDCACCAGTGIDKDDKRRLDSIKRG